MAISYPHTRWSCNPRGDVFGSDRKGHCPKDKKECIQGQSRLLDAIVAAFLAVDRKGGHFYRDGLDIKRVAEKDVILRLHACACS